MTNQRLPLSITSAVQIPVRYALNINQKLVKGHEVNGPFVVVDFFTLSRLESLLFKGVNNPSKVTIINRKDVILSLLSTCSQVHSVDNCDKSEAASFDNKCSSDPSQVRSQHQSEACYSHELNRSFVVVDFLTLSRLESLRF